MGKAGKCEGRGGCREGAGCPGKAGEAKARGRRKEGDAGRSGRHGFLRTFRAPGGPRLFLRPFFAAGAGRNTAGGRASGGAGVRKRCPGLRRAGGALRAFFASGTAFGVLPQGGRAAGRWPRRRSSNPGRRAVHAEKTPLGHGRLVPRAFFYGRSGAEEGGRERRCGRKRRQGKGPSWPR